MNATSNVRSAEPFESEVAIEVAPWDRHADPNWITRLAASLSTIQQSAWERKPQVVADGERKAHISLDGYAHDVADANEHAEILLRRHTPYAGLMEGSYTVMVTSKRRP
jgi:hypothetical protein